MRLGRAAISLTARLTVGFVALLAVAHIGICVYLDYALQAEFLGEDRRELGNQALFVRQVVAEGRSLREVQADPRLLEARALHPRFSFALRDAQGRMVESSYNAGSLIDAAAAAKSASGRVSDLLRTVVRGERVWRVLLSEASLGDEARTPVAVVVGLDVTEREDFARRYRSRLAVAAVVAAAAAGLIGLPLVRTALTPLNVMARRAGAISAARLGERLPEEGVPSELQGLSAAFNQTLERLEDSFRRLSQFSSDLAHDLRTPIGNLMGEAQVALRRARTAEEYQAVLASAVEEYERLNRMIEDMLFLARADNAQAGLHRTALEVAVEVGRVAEYYEGLLAERGVALKVQGKAALWADPELLRRALSNLISNAIAHTPAGGEIEVALAQDRDGSVRIEVSNPGPGIPAQALPHIFDRFFRADAARGGSDKGSGLGLAIVQSIMRLHGGSATAHSVRGERTTFFLDFPPHTASVDMGVQSSERDLAAPVLVRAPSP
jgi:two-component system heavy metal sensor histidine kinase CusS